MDRMNRASQLGTSWQMWFTPPIDLSSELTLKALLDDPISHFRFERRTQ
jgi:hypothetical protein